MGKGIRVEGRVSKFFFLIRPNLRDEIHLLHSCRCIFFLV
jgi:hypothetical protein